MTDMNRKKILLLGGSAQQVPAIKASKAMGYYTVLIDYLPDNPGQYEADIWYAESTTNVDAVERIAEKEKVSGILAYASDPAALPAAIVAERLGLPTNPSESVEILGVKHKFRKFLQDANFACPKNISFPANLSAADLSVQLTELRFPIVVKPTDSSGSKGVTFLEDLNGLEEAIAHASAYSRNRILIAEEYIKRGVPFVVGGDIFVEDGEIVLKGEMACLRDKNGTGLIPIGKMKPAGLTSRQRDKLYEELQRLITVLDLKFGEFNIEVLIDSQDQPHFLEVGPRAGGNMIPIQLSDAYNVDLIKANINVAMGESSGLCPIELDECFMTYVLHSHYDGTFSHVDFSEYVLPYIYRKVIYKSPGDKVELFDGAGKALGIVFFKFPNEQIMRDVESHLDNYIKVILK